MRRRFQLDTTLYGKRLVTRAQLYQLHAEVTRAASQARQDDPKFLANYERGVAAAAWRTEQYRELA